MFIKSFKDENGKTLYMLFDNDNKPVSPVMKYLKYLDTVNKSSNTLKTYCNSLKLYFMFLDNYNLDYIHVDFDSLTKFIEWLKDFKYDNKDNVIHLSKRTPKQRSSSSINLILGVVLSFYEYLYRSDKIDDNISDFLNEDYINNRKTFLAHARKSMKQRRKMMKLNNKKGAVDCLTNEQVSTIIAATNNIRDKFLIRLLFGTGFRIGELLSLHHEDFIINKKDNKYEIQLKERGLLENGAELKTGARKIPVDQELMDLYDDYQYEILDEIGIETDLVFVKISGDNIGKPMDYVDVDNLFRRISKKTGIHVHPHLFRHTHGTIFYRQTKDLESLRDRLGHANIQTSIDFYVHINDDDRRNALDKASPGFNLDTNLEIDLEIDSDEEYVPF